MRCASSRFPTISATPRASSLIPRPPRIRNFPRRINRRWASTRLWFVCPSVSKTPATSSRTSTARFTRCEIVEFTARESTMAQKHIAVIGAGTIGASWAAYFLSRGMSVTASDPAPNGESFVRDYIRIAWPTLQRLGLAPGASPDRLRFERDPVAAVAGAEFVQESAPEREEMKVELFERLDRALPP